MRSNLTIGTKLMAGTAAMFALALVLSYSGLAAISVFKERFDTTADVTVRKLALADTILTARSEMVSAQRGIILAAFDKDPAEFDRYKELFKQNTELIQKSLDEMRLLIHREEARALTAETTAKVAEWQSHYQDMLQRCTAGDMAGANRIRKDVIQPIYKKVEADGRRLVAIQSEILAEDKTTLAAQHARSRWIAFSLLGLSLLVGGVVVWIVRQVSSTLRQIAAEMGDGAHQVAAAASQVSASSQSLAQGSSEQAASIEETSASAEEINSMTRKNAENSKVAAGSMNEVSQRITDANRNLEQMVTSMNEINASSEKISKIIKVIDEIAFQTNILALNAAVEAARAGEAGMGFAVVADEVRNLAQRCAQAAKDTAGLIEESIAKSNDGKTKLDHVAIAVQSITESATKVKTLVDEVKLGSEEQARGIEQVSKAITQMEQVTQTTAANAEESASASEELSAQSDTLRAIVGRLNGMVGGGTEVVTYSLRESKRAAAAPASAARKPGSAGRGVIKPALDPVHAHADAFPLEEQFKEF